MMLGRKIRERRREDAEFFLVERRDRGNIWTYGQILLAVGLLPVTPSPRAPGLIDRR